ncbi:MAG: peptidase M20 [Roseibacillus sp.]|nr:peptidase M20 [Roseibacillus sp.]
MSRWIDEFFELLRFPSISTDSGHREDVKACADWLSARMVSAGLQSEIHPTEGHPVVIGRNEQEAGRPTVLVYGHYDVQPVDPLDLWESDPFDPVIRDGKIWARGATDNKGQFFAHLCGITETIEKEGKLPVNLIMLLEGEEEIGSPNLRPFLEAHRAELDCDVIVVSDTGMVAPGVPTLGYGLRGITCCEFVLRGPARDLHSGVYGGAVANPGTAVARLVASLHDEHGRVAIEGFYDDVVALEDWEREMWSSVPGTGEEDILGVTGAPSLFGESGYTSAERLWARPTAEVNGIWGGYQGEGSKTVLPAEAFAKLSFRLVPHQDPIDIMEKVEAHLQKHCPEGVTVEVERGHHGQAYHTDPHSSHGKAAQEALRKTFGVDPVLIREGGSIPIIQDFKEVLGVDTLLLGLALPDCQIHSPNENFTVENFEGGIRLNRVLFEELASIQG